MLMSPAELGPEKDCVGEAQQQLQTTDINLILFLLIALKCSGQKNNYF
jgi:hypothetical protein